jgi:hypothetical protein
MSTITIPADLEVRIAEEAKRRGTTPELVAVDGLRQLFPAPSPIIWMASLELSMAHRKHFRRIAVRNLRQNLSRSNRRGCGDDANRHGTDCRAD